jgi:ubiquinone/menaquinone biosynthesis C-methylase UbiE
MSHIINRGRITGVDFSQDVVEAGTIRFSHLIKAGILDLHCADLEHLPFESGTFTKACTVNTIYFWQNPDAAAAELHRVLKKDGMVLVCFTPKSVMEKLGRVIHHGFTLYEPEQVATLLAAAGFRSVQLFQDKHSSGECMIAAGKK